jgi:hypothetical protein
LSSFFFFGFNII